MGIRVCGFGGGGFGLLWVWEFVCFSFQTAFLVILGESLASLKPIEVLIKTTESSQFTPISINKVIYQLTFLQTAYELKEIPSQCQKSNTIHLGIS